MSAFTQKVVTLSSKVVPLSSKVVTLSSFLCLLLINLKLLLEFSGYLIIKDETKPKAGLSIAQNFTFHRQFMKNMSFLDIEEQRSGGHLRKSKYFCKHPNLLTKVMLYNNQINDVIQGYIAERSVAEHTTRRCDVDVNTGSSFKVVRGYTSNVGSLAQHTQTPVGQIAWMLASKQQLQKNETNSLKTGKDFFIDVTKFSLANHVIIYDQTMTSDALHTLVLSSRQSNSDGLIDLQPLVTQYYDPYVMSSDQTQTWKTLGARYPSACVARSTSNVTQPFRATSLPDYLLHIDYTRVTSSQTCSDYNAKLLQSNSETLLHNDITGDILTSLDVIPEGGIVLREGSIHTSGNQVLRHFHCFYAHRNYDVEETAELESKNVSDLACYEEVFVISDYWGDVYYHILVDQITKMAPFVWLLKQRPEIAIHASGKTLKFLPNVLKIFGLENRLISGTVKAELILRPNDCGCMNPPLPHLQIANYLFHKYIKAKLMPIFPSVEKRLKVCPQRSVIKTLRIFF